MSNVLQDIADWIEKHDTVRDWNEYENKSFIENMKPGGSGWNGVLEDQKKFKPDQSISSSSDLVLNWLVTNWKLALIGFLAVFVLLRD